MPNCKRQYFGYLISFFFFLMKLETLPAVYCALTILHCKPKCLQHFIFQIIHWKNMMACLNINDRVINMKNMYSCKYCHLPRQTNGDYLFDFRISKRILHIGNINCKEPHRNLSPCQKNKRNQWIRVYIYQCSPGVRQGSFSQYSGREKQFNSCLKWAVLTLLGCQKILDVSSFSVHTHFLREAFLIFLELWY